VSRIRPEISRAPAGPARLAWGGLCAVLAIAVATGAWSLLRGSAEAEAPASLETLGEYGSVPDFSLTERSGRPVSKSDLAGGFWVADFIFTRCNGICPVLTSRMSSLASAISSIPGGDQVRFVSFSVDPAWDTPEVLSAYAETAGGNVAAEGRWLFLTGSRDVLYRLIGEGFHLSVADRSADPQAQGELVTHSDRFVLVDPRGQIRAYYHGTDEDSVARLKRDLERLIRQEGS